MKTRIIQTRFWNDEIQDDLSLCAQHLYIYLLTCSHINMSGIFQVLDSIVSAESKLDKEELKKAKEELSSLKKAFFKSGWIFVVNAQKNNNYQSSPKNKKSFANEIKQIPQNILDYFNSVSDTTINSSIDTNIDTTIDSSIKNNFYSDDDSSIDSTIDTSLKSQSKSKQIIINKLDLNNIISNELIGGSGGEEEEMLNLWLSILGTKIRNNISGNLEAYRFLCSEIGYDLLPSFLQIVRVLRGDRFEKRDLKSKLIDYVGVVDNLSLIENYAQSCKDKSQIDKVNTLSKGVPSI